ncbi:two component transcriptional regulator, LuxR family [Thiothrix caldifontis]|uniref:Two component transcriptional regulator, LuxR family n=1 Tax=Thiothrix caldifontis TaxID=525918 RepID=A0A1H4GWL5_9GAMM|nr:response regulator transcription factor [Thiothrix caldifontis]SEB13278.1 two component transcriptional regulator, LuxR family [Thiothrix caldifontis]
MKQDKVCRIFIVDDHPAVRQGVMAIVSHEPDMLICGEASGVPDAMQHIATLMPDVAVIDISLKIGNGIDLVKRVKAEYPSVRMLVWSMFPDTLYAARALRAGALGYLNKSDSTEQLVEAIRMVAQGKIYLTEETSARLLQEKFNNPVREDGALSLDLLSDRELEVFKLIGEGVSTQQIAESIMLSISTVETYRQRIKAKLNINSNTELVRSAVQWLLETSQ